MRKPRSLSHVVLGGLGTFPRDVGGGGPKANLLLGHKITQLSSHAILSHDAIWSHGTKVFLMVRVAWCQSTMVSFDTMAEQAVP